eukprot:TRINITY_DN84828_c0_g1_i1.p1 TRINITY_DN84828_c0_g1~~TRINITY_DN84828_c0_g1_i1.p1  ORF type:complete len:237 (-),score=45.23 TRINITY_DN84828_c0_g1_i1:250-960(-)
MDIPYLKKIGLQCYCPSQAEAAAAGLGAARPAEVLAGAASEPDYDCTVCIALPQEHGAYELVQSIRQGKYKGLKAMPKAFKRWPPHINMFWPFIPAALLPDVLPELQALIQQFGCFSIRLAKFSKFVHGEGTSRKATVHLDIESPQLGLIFEALAQKFPAIAKFQPCIELDVPFAPHLTVGSCFKVEEVDALIARIESEWPTFDFEVKYLTVLKAASKEDRFEEYATLPLGPSRNA